MRPGKVFIELLSIYVDFSANGCNRAVSIAEQSEIHSQSAGIFFCLLQGYSPGKIEEM